MTERKTYKEDLEYWLWVTKGTRFHAHERLLRQNKWSNLSIGILSAYIIIINLVSVYKVPTSIPFLSDVYVGFGTTALSILILVFSQLENSNDFKIKAEKFHDCSRELGKLYRQLRKRRREVSNDDELKSDLEDITQKYESILDRCENHLEIDYLYFKSTHPVDFKMNWWTRNWVYIKYYFNTVFIYHILIILPVIAFIIIEVFGFFNKS